MKNNNSLNITLTGIAFVILTSFCSFDLRSFDWKLFAIIILPQIFSTIFICKYTYDLARNSTKVFNARYKLYYAFKEKEPYLNNIELKFLERNNDLITISILMICISYGNHNFNKETLKSALYGKNFQLIFKDFKYPLNQKLRLIKYIKNFNTNESFQKFRAIYETKQLLQKHNNTDNLSFFFSIISLGITIMGIIKIEFTSTVITRLVIAGVFIIIDIISSISEYFQTANYLTENVTNFYDIFVELAESVKKDKDAENNI